MTGVPAGELDRRISICRAAQVDDGTATIVGPVVEIGTRWARKVDVGDGERLAAGEIATDFASRFLVRADNLTRTIGGKDVIRLKGRSFFVVGVKDSREFDDGIEITTASRSDQL